MSGQILTLHSDGGARGNPGPAAAAYILSSESGPIFKNSLILGVATNNQAEYMAITSGLGFLFYNLSQFSVGSIARLNIYLDSNLIVNQLNGQYRLKNAQLKPYFQYCQFLLSQFHFPYAISHIPRAQNALADQLVNDALDATYSSRVI